MSSDSIVGDGLAQSPYEQMRAERDAARALLREARPCVYLYATWSNEHVETMRLLDRIEAALKGTK